jgi:thioredoxin reductase
MQDFDAIIIGGSYAGLSAAMALGRSRRRVLLLDTGRPCNRQTPHSHNFLTQDGATPAALRAQALAEVQHYPTIELRADEALTASALPGGGFRVETAAGARVTAARLLLATGVVDLLPALPGFAECWGISVLHCPYCHGYEVADQRLGVLGNGDMGFAFARLIHNWSRQLTLFTDGPATLSPEQQETLARHGITVEETPLAGFDHAQGQLRAVQLADGSARPLDAVFARVPFEQAGILAPSRRWATCRSMISSEPACPACLRPAMPPRPSGPCRPPWLPVARPAPSLTWSSSRSVFRPACL